MLSSFISVCTAQTWDTAYSQGHGMNHKCELCPSCRGDSTEAFSSLCSVTRLSTAVQLKKKILVVYCSLHGWINDKAQISVSLIFYLMDWLALCLLDYIKKKKKSAFKNYSQKSTCDGLLKAVLYLISAGGPWKFEAFSPLYHSALFSNRNTQPCLPASRWRLLGPHVYLAQIFLAGLQRGILPLLLVFKTCQWQPVFEHTAVSLRWGTCRSGEDQLIRPPGLDWMFREHLC